MTIGDVGTARDHFTPLMWRVGNGRLGPKRCYQPQFKELPEESEGGAGELAGHESITDHVTTPLRDLYKVLWCFERINAPVQSERLKRS